MNNKEIELVNEEFVARDDTYNSMVGGYNNFPLSKSYFIENGEYEKYIFINNVYTSEVLRITTTEYEEKYKNDINWNRGFGPRKGRIMNKDKMIKFIYDKDIDVAVNMGWEFGAGPRNGKLMSKGNETKLILFENIEKAKEEGWEMGLTQEGKERLIERNYGNTNVRGKIQIYNPGTNGSALIDSENFYDKEYNGWERGRPKRRIVFEIDNEVISLTNEEFKELNEDEREIIENVGYREMVSSGSIGMIWITNGTENRLINKNKEIPKDWSAGRTEKEKEKRTLLNKNGISKYVPLSRIDEFLSVGWAFGLDEKTKSTLGNFKILYKYKNNKKIIKYVKNDKVQLYLDNGWINGRAFDHFTGRKAINKNGKVKFVLENEITTYLKDGWTKGTGITKSKGKCWVHKDKELKQITKDELESYLEDGWNKGYGKGTRLPKKRRK